MTSQPNSQANQSNKISADDLSNLKFANQRLVDARTALIKAEGGFECIQAAIMGRYSLEEMDGIDLETGEIKKAEKP